MGDDLRDQIAAAVLAEIEAEGSPHLELHDAVDAENLTDALMPVVQAAITEARREAYDEGVLACIHSYHAPPRKQDNPYAAGEHDAGLGASGATSKSDPPSLGASAEPVVAQVAAGEHDTPAGEPSPAAGRHEWVGCGEEYGCKLGLADDACHQDIGDDLICCLGYADPVHAAVHQPAQNPVTPMVVGADGRGDQPAPCRLNDGCILGRGHPGWPNSYCAYSEADLVARRRVAMVEANRPTATPPAQQPAPSDAKSDVRGCDEGAQQPAGPDVDTAFGVTGPPCGCIVHLPNGFAAWCPHGTYIRTPGSPLLDARDATIRVQDDAHRKLNAENMTLIAAVKTRDAEIERLRADLDDFRQSLVGEEAETDRLEAEIRELRAELDTVGAVLRSQTDNVIATEKLADGLAVQRDDARARLDEIRALCEEWAGVHPMKARIRAILDREADDG